MRLGKIAVVAVFLSLAVVWGLANQPTAPVIPVTGGTDTPVVFPIKPTPIPGQTSIRLYVVQALKLSSPLAIAGTPLQASFVVKNVGEIPLSIDQITVGVYDGLTWKAVPGASFPGMSGLILQPGQEATLQASQTFWITGEFFAQPVIFSNGNWNIIPGATREWFEVDPAKTPNPQ